MDNICEPRIIHKLMLYGADPNIKDSSFRSCMELIDEIEDEMLRK
jgi:hypothetical protein